MNKIDQTKVWNRSEILHHYEKSHKLLFDWLENHDDARWIKGPEGKWNTGQHIIHLIQSAKPLNKAINFPKFILKWKFGLANRPPKSYDEVVERYQTKLQSAGQSLVSPFSKNMPTFGVSDKPGIIASLKKSKDRLIQRSDKWSEQALDKYILPHPLMGRTLIRELLMWSSYHTLHHLNILKEKHQ